MTFELLWESAEDIKKPVHNSVIRWRLAKIADKSPTHQHYVRVDLCRVRDSLGTASNLGARRCLLKKGAIFLAS